MLSANPSFTKVITVLVRRNSKSTGNTVLFVGASDAGKTAILSSVSSPIHPVGGNQAQVIVGIVRYSWRSTNNYPHTLRCRQILV